jgi:hypothetical protein
VFDVLIILKRTLLAEFRQAVTRIIVRFYREAVKAGSTRDPPTWDF